MSRLSKIEIYAIQWLEHQNHSALEIATELKLTEKQVVKALEKVSGVNKPGKIKTVTEPVAKQQKPSLFIMESQNKKNKGVAIMTKEASEKADVERSSTSNSTTNKRTSNSIFRPKN